jgi:hypothetical protein
MRFLASPIVIAIGCTFVGCFQDDEACNDDSKTCVDDSRHAGPTSPIIVNGLTLRLNASGTRFPVGSEFRLDAVISNRSERDIVLWLTDHSFDVEIVDTDAEGHRWEYSMPQDFGTHDLGVWKEDIHVLSPGATKTVSWNLGRHTPGKMEFRVRYFNDAETLTLQEQDTTITHVWTGDVVSQGVTIEFQ